MVDLSELSALLEQHFEWLLTYENGRTLPLTRDEFDLTTDGAKTLFGFIDTKGFTTVRILDFAFEEDKIALDIAKNFGLNRETIHLNPRIQSDELSANIELARLEKANQIGQIFVANNINAKLVRTALKPGNGRVAQIIFERDDGEMVAVMADVSETMQPEMLLTTAILWNEKLRTRKKNPIFTLQIAASNRIARNLQKLSALLTEATKQRIEIWAISIEKRQLNRLKTLRLTDLWREKPKKLTLPETIDISQTAEQIRRIAPNEIDVIFSKQGETLRFRGLPFARVRRILKVEKAWFGIDENRRPVTEKTLPELAVLIENLKNYRCGKPPSLRHELYRLSPESWLESILLRNIKLLDANLILSPIYNQFRTLADKIDLLALRQDGRLVIIELKTSPDREMIFQAVDYWRKIEQQRRRGELKRAKVFGDIEIIDQPALVYTVAPALSFHQDYEFFANKLAPEIEIWRFELHQKWRETLKVIARKNYKK